MKMIKNIESYIKLIILILVVLYLSVGTILIINKEINYLIFSNILSIFGAVCLLLYIVDKIINKEKIKLKDIIIILLGIFGYISYKYAYDQNIALYGVYARNEGLFVILTYYAIFLLSSTISQKHIKVIMCVFIITGLFQILLGTLQTLQITNILGYDRTHNWSTRFKVASGTFGNPNFYSTYILMGLVYVYSKLLQQKSKICILLYLFLIIIFLYGLIIGHTLGCYIAFGIIFIITMIIYIFKGNTKKKLLTIGIILITLSFVIYNMNGKLKHQMITFVTENYYEIKSILNDGINESTGNNRIYVWKKTLEYIPQNLMNGIGIDNFKFIQDGNIICATFNNRVECFDKAHNEFLHKLATEGIFSFGLYIILLIYIIIFYIKYKQKNKNEKFTVFIAYLIQSVVGISVITVAPIFYIVMGFILSKDERK